MSSRTPFWWGLLAVGLVACNPEVEQSTGGGSGASSTGGGGSSACDALLPEPAEPVTLKVENKTGASIFLQDSCDISGPDGVTIDGSAVLEKWLTYSCDEHLACEPLAPDCFGGNAKELAAGETFTAVWSGHFRAEESTTAPEACTEACSEPSTFGFCFRKLAAAPGPHTLKVEYGASSDGPYETLEVPFDLPATEVTAVIDSM